MKRAIAVFMLLGILGCGGQPQHGTVKDGIYRAADSSFLIAVPPLQPGKHLTDHFESGGFTVVFSDDFGSLFRLEGLPAERAGLGGQASEPALQTVFERQMLPLFRSVSAAAQARQERYMPDLLGGAVLYRVDIPGGSNMEVQVVGQGSPRRMDSTRAVLLFVHKATFFQASVQVASLAEDRPDARAWTKAAETAVDWAKSLQ